MLQGQDIKLKRVYPNGKIERFTARVWDKNRYIESQLKAAQNDKENPHTVEFDGDKK